jgi:rhamnose utilization protein RhaD (predicted bifunctional aldolase and dehydrogenase)
MPDDVLSQLVAMSRSLGDPANDYVILGEGNTSARADDETFWIKASGTHLQGIEANDFVRVRCAPVLAMLDGPEPSDEQTRQGLSAAKVDPSSPGRPSMETVFHALALSEAGVNFVGHTHPTVVNAILCSQKAEEAIRGRLFPDEIVVCGPAPAYVPYTDPGLPLARVVRQVLQAYIVEYGEAPKVILMQNHGLIAMGPTAQEVKRITAMCVKAARVLLGTYVLGGAHFLSGEAVARIHTRPDEAYRRRKLS